MKKVWINYILTVSLLLAGFSVQAAENSIVRVGLFYGSSSKQAVSVGADSPITIRFGADVMVSELAISVNYAPASDSLTFYYGEMNIDAKKELTVSSQSGIISIEGKKIPRRSCFAGKWRGNYRNQCPHDGSVFIWRTSQ